MLKWARSKTRRWCCSDLNNIANYLRLESLPVISAWHTTPLRFRTCCVMYVAFHWRISPSMDIRLLSMDGMHFHGWKEVWSTPPYISSPVFYYQRRLPSIDNRHFNLTTTIILLLLLLLLTPGAAAPNWALLFLR